MTTDDQIETLIHETGPTTTERALAVALDALDDANARVARLDDQLRLAREAHDSLIARYGQLRRDRDDAVDERADLDKMLDSAYVENRRAIDEAWTLIEQHVPVNAAAIVATLPADAAAGGGCSSWDVAAVRWRNRWVGDPEAASRARAAGSARARAVIAEPGSDNPVRARAVIAEPGSDNPVRLSGFTITSIRARTARPTSRKAENGAESAGSGDDLRRAVDDQALALAMLDGEQLVDLARSVTALYQAVGPVIADPPGGHLRARIERVEGALANLAAGRAITATVHQTHLFMIEQSWQARCACGWEGPRRDTQSDADRDEVAHAAQEG